VGRPDHKIRIARVGPRWNKAIEEDDMVVSCALVIAEVVVMVEVVADADAGCIRGAVELEFVRADIATSRATTVIPVAAEA